MRSSGRIGRTGQTTAFSRTDLLVYVSSTYRLCTDIHSTLKDEKLARAAHSTAGHQHAMDLGNFTSSIFSQSFISDAVFALLMLSTHHLVLL